MKYWLMKSEPTVYSIDDLEKEKIACWEGVRNYSARNTMRSMSVGDLAFFYHSNADPSGVAGIARICKEAYPDHYAWNTRSKYYDKKSSKENPRWYMVDVEWVQKFPNLVSLQVIKITKGLQNMVLVKRSRLSVQPVTNKEFEIIKKMGND